jgi:nitroreductase
MDVFEAIRSRRAVRNFTDEPVEQSTLERLISLAVHAPSAMNLQPWAFAVVRGRERLLHISRSAKAHLLHALPDTPAAPQHRAALSDPAFDIFHGAPALVIVSATSDEESASEDCALAAENLMLAAHAIELGSCWIGFARPWLNTAEAKAELELPQSFHPVAPIIIGHPALEQPPLHPRREPEILWIGA